jgi:hypothetical protein
VPQPTIAEFVYLIAIAHVWARGSIFKSFRQGFLPALFDCPLCAGFWIGVLGHFLFLIEPDVIVFLGIGSIVGTLALAVCATIRRI